MGPGPGKKERGLCLTRKNRPMSKLKKGQIFTGHSKAENTMLCQIKPHGQKTMPLRFPSPPWARSL